MRIFIDEAGSFLVPRTGADSFSLVLALAIPSTAETQLLYDFVRLRDSWPATGIEIKGSSLNESEAAQVIEVCLRHDVLVGFRAINMATHDDALVDPFKAGQAGELLAHLTPQHNPRVVKSLQQASEKILAMPNQLFIQAFVTIHLLLDLMPEVLLYYVQRTPEELGSIAWIIDRKDHTLTQMEEMWSSMILPFSESHYAKAKFHTLQGADYSHFHKRYSTKASEMDAESARHMAWLTQAHGVRQITDHDWIVSSGKLFSEQRDFKDSRACLGVQLADNLATILRRALNDKLQRSGWGRFGELIVRQRNIGSYFMQIGKGDSLKMPQHAASVCRILDRRAKSMIVGD